jgi:ElaB/YqjD/DUF883 family membrane-anchored ribosome-binding protein
MRKPLAVALVVVALSVSACSSSSPSAASGTTTSSPSPTPISATDYVAGVCTAIGTWQATVKQEGSTFNPSTTDVAALKQSWLDFLDGIIKSTQTLVSSIQALGTPDTSDAQAAAERLEADFTTLLADFQKLRDESASLSTSSSSTFMSKFQQLLQQFQQDAQGVTQDLSQVPPEFQSAASAAPECEALASASVSPAA